MLLASEEKKLKELEKVLNSRLLGSKASLSVDRNRKVYDALRDVYRLYQDVVLRCHNQRKDPEGKSFKRLRILAERALDELGGQGEPAPVSLKQYDHLAYGPFLGVSDDGSAAASICEAALCSPKMRVIGNAAPIVVGVSHDAERLAAVGEVAVGPSEYHKIRLECTGRILTSTNVGTRLNLRYYKKRPVIDIPGGPLETVIEKVKQQSEVLLEPFWHTPDTVPRPVTAFAYFETRIQFEHRLVILKELAGIFSKGNFCNPEYHKLGLLVRVCGGKRGLRTAKQGIDLAKKANLAEVAIDGIVRQEAADKISTIGLLNYFNPQQTVELLRYSAKKKVPVSPRNLVDTETVARNVWAGLNVARNMGLELGKYGLFPLTIDESDKVMELIQGWFSSWTAAPACYIDFPAVDSTNIYTEANIGKGIRKWLQVVSKNKIPVVLIDTADKDKGRRLLKNSSSDRVGILQLGQIAEIDAFAKQIGIKVLWAGGITIPQAFEMGKLGVFGVYVTSAAAVAKPVSGRYRRDPMLASEKEPTFQGVYRTKLLLESGFLAGRMKEYGFNDRARELEQAAEKLIRTLKRDYRKKTIESEQAELASLAEKAWQYHLKHYSSGKRKRIP